MGAMVSSLARGDSLETSLRYAVAGGSAALLNPGTELCRREDVQRLADKVSVNQVAGIKLGRTLANHRASSCFHDFDEAPRVAMTVHSIDPVDLRKSISCQDD